MVHDDATGSKQVWLMRTTALSVIIITHTRQAHEEHHTTGVTVQQPQLPHPTAVMYCWVGAAPLPQPCSACIRYVTHCTVFALHAVLLLRTQPW